MASVTVFRDQLEDFYDEVAHKYFNDIDATVKAEFRAQVPVDTGLLQSRHRRLPIFRDRKVWVARYVAPTGYDIFVHQGTGEFISSPRIATVRVNQLKARIITRRHRGQRPNPWLYRSFVRLGFQQVRWIRT